MKSLIYAFFCLAVCGVIALGLMKDDQAAFSGDSGEKKFKPKKRVSRGEALAQLEQERMPSEGGQN